MNRTIKEDEADQKTIRGIVFPLNVKRFHYDSHVQLRTHLADCGGIQLRTKAQNPQQSHPYEYICKICTSEPDRFILNPIHQMPRLSS